ncbi:helix-turn-helix domain-containing protein [Ihubacter sp. rT4E-8]|uniref:helix-turn-helix domain-containing protein n=1 Tax=unclassified Ihubacter TaxID=2633299 RepID=UPI00137AA121
MNLDVQMKIAGNIRSLRNAFGYTQTEVSDELHICRSTYALFETGKKVPGADTILDLAEFYHVKVSTVLQSSNDHFLEDALCIDKENKNLIALLDVYNQLSPHSQGRLLERAVTMLEEESLPECLYG